jgi:hypothetical protein
MTKTNAAAWAALGLVIVLGTVVRYADLGTHFGHEDDIGVAATILWQDNPSLSIGTVLARKILAVPDQWTYAPLQFLLTPLLLSQDQSYRQVLFWGRFPSFLFGVASMVLMARFLRILRRGEDPFPEQLLGAALIAFSWENVLYAKQMETFTIGVAAAIVLMILLVQHLRDVRLGWGQMAWLGLVLGLLICAQYQILFFLPGFFIVLFLAYAKAAGSVRKVALRMSVAAGIVLAFFVPLYILFLRTVPIKAGYIHWNAGPDQSFAFSLPGQGGFLGAAAYALTFFAKNLYIVFETTIAFSFEDGVVTRLAGVMLFPVFLAGMASLAAGRDPVRRSLGWFIGISALTWAALIVMRKLTLGPTRHTLILLPLFVLGITEGLRALSVLLRAGDRTVRTASAALTAFIAAAFLISFPAVRAERQDPFDEQRMAGLLSQYSVRSVLQYGYTQNVFLMRDVRRSLPVIAKFDLWPAAGKDQALREFPQGSLAFVSQRGPLPDDIRAILDRYGYQRVYADEQASDVESDFSRRTKNGSNGRYVYIYTRPGRRA